ncbi:MAG TPA: glucose-6-phosphate dehydrogenase assembly protein OpcA [Bryobacteraceae bacterium]|nr:glucose-6-phosphate dehydrogenase assembly protein OpcA [Bryobacteraceae bacterium]
MTATLEPEKILKDLRNLWIDLGRETDVAGGVLRACGMTLVVAAEAGSDPQDLRHTLGVLMHNHPARAIVLRFRDQPGLEANVFSQCWMPFGKHQQICAEGVEIAVGDEELPHAAQLLLPLLAPDLPAVLWCRGPRVFEDDAFKPLYSLVQKIIVDSYTAADPYAAVEAVRELRQQGRLVADLSWTKLTGLREFVASLFDAGSAAGIQAVEVIYAGDVPSPSAIYFSTWMERALRGVPVALKRGSEGPRSIRAVILKGDHEVVLKRPDSGTMEMYCGGKMRKSTILRSSEEALMSEELSILGLDPVFDKVLLGGDAPE